MKKQKTDTNAFRESQYQAKVRQERREAINENKKLLKEIEQKDKEVKAITRHKNFKTNVRIRPPARIKGSSTAFLVWSDWHIEEEVKGAKTNGLNEFNLEIARRRINNCAANSAKLVNEMGKGEEIDKIVLCLLGDFFSGSIHDELMESNQLRPIDASLKAREWLKASIEFLLKNTTQDIEVVCTVGN